MTHAFKAKIYKTGINWCVDVPLKITAAMLPEKGRIYIRGTINGFDFTKTLMPVKDAPYRLFVNGEMMKGGNTALGKIAAFEIEQVPGKKRPALPMPKLLSDQLRKHKLSDAFEALTASRKKDILHYLNHLKSEESLQRNIEKVITQLKQKEKNTRIP